MEFEPGPLRLFPDDEFPAAGVPSNFALLAAEEATALDSSATALEREQLAIASSGEPRVDPGVALELGDAASEHERQSRESDPAIGGVAAALGSSEEDLSGLTLTLVEDLRTPEPPYPRVPPGPDEENPEAPETTPPYPDEPGKLPGWPENQPVARGGAGGSGADFIAHYRFIMSTDVPQIHGRAATSLELELAGIYHYWFGYIDDAAHNWLLGTYVVPYPDGFQP